MKKSNSPAGAKRKFPAPQTNPRKYTNICIEMPEIDSLNIDTARNRIERWKGQSVDMRPMNGFFMRYDDLLGLMHSLHTHAKDKKIMGVRGYLGLHAFQDIHPDERFEAVSVMFVAVEAADGYPYGKDIVFGEEGRSEIYDLTQPCPNCCDLTSPLNSGNAKKKVALRSLTPKKKKKAAPARKAAPKKKAVSKKNR